MTNQERGVRAERILRRQNSGKISKWDAAAEFDRLLDESGELHFYSNTTGLSDTWDGIEVMVFPHRANELNQFFNPSILLIPSNTGIITQGERRGCVILKPGETKTDAHGDVLREWGNPGERKFHP